MPRMTDRVYGSDDGRSGYHNVERCRDQQLSIGNLETQPALDAAVNFKILIVYSKVDRGIQSAS